MPAAVRTPVVRAHGYAADPALTVPGTAYER
jgi:hypothetical protein